MPPKKQQKMSLNEFLGDSTLGSWADEMDSLPTYSSARGDEDRPRPGGRGRDDFLSSRSDRAHPPREDLPLPTEPPYTAFVGNLVFDLTEQDLEQFFSAQNPKSVKIIRDRDDKPKGFGYVEFADLEGLKEALAKSGSSLSGRTIRVSVADPPKERTGFGGSGGGGFDDDKFASNWRRDGPLPDAPSNRDGPRSRRPDGPPSREPPPSTAADNASDWRSTRRPSPPAPTTEPDQGGPSFKRKGSGFRQDGAPPGPADTEENWLDRKFAPSAPEEGSPKSRFGSLRAPPKEKETPSPSEETDWRRPRATSRNSTSPSNSTPPTPQLARRKLDLLPRSNSGSAVPSPLSSPNPANPPSSSRSNPFGAAKPVDVSAREAVIAEKLQRDRESTKERVMQNVQTMSRTSSRTGTQREPRTPTTSSAPSVQPSGPASPTSATSPVSAKPEPSPRAFTAAPSVRASFSFASAAAGKKEAGEKEEEIQEVTEQVAQVQV